MSRWPRTAEAFAAVDDGQALFERLRAIDAAVAEKRTASPIPMAPAGGPDRAAVLDCDVLMAGGGLSLLLAASLARAGLRVVVLDRARIGRTHRGWNASRRELAQLTEAGLFSEAEVDALIERTYRTGFCRWAGRGTYYVRHVLDCAVDSAALLERARLLTEGAGARLLDHHALAGVRLGSEGVEVRARSLGADFGSETTVTARLLLDGMGAASPWARPDLFCPTVGGVLTDLVEGDAPDEFRPDVGEILVTTEGIEDGRQHVWEGFPGREGLTTYLFHYARASDLGDEPLASLFERFLTSRARYKRGVGRLVRPTFGIIPGHSRLRPTHVSPADRVLMVGDAAARHSPLTFCGFGSMLRTVGPLTRFILRALDAHPTQEHLNQAVFDPPMLSLVGALASMLTGRGVQVLRGNVNDLLDLSFSTLAAEGEAHLASFLRDEMSPLEVLRFLTILSRHRPSIYPEVFRVLGARGLGRWSFELGRAVFRSQRAET